MDEKVIIESEQYNFKSYWITVLVIAGISLLLAIPNIYWKWFFENPFDWFVEDGWYNIFFDIMLLTLIVGTICYFWLRKMNLVVSDKRVYGQAAFGRQVDLPLDSITAIGKGIIKCWMCTFPRCLCWRMTMQNDLPLYPYSAKEATQRNELPAWRESFRENCACAGAIEISIREHFDGMHLKDGAVEQVVKQFGYKRTAHVLANTVQELSFDGRFHSDNKEWANRHYVPEDSEHNACFVVRSHPAVLDGFISEYRKLVMCRSFRVLHS